MPEAGPAAFDPDAPAGGGTLVVLDLKGLKCPLPVLKTRKRMRTLKPGDRISVETTDPLAGIDIPHFCREDGHVLERNETLPNGHRFLIRKTA